MSSPQRMTPEDSAFWRMETDVSRMHSVTLAVFAGPAPSPAELQAHIARRIHLVPRFRQRVAEVPLDLGRPMWVDDPGFDLDNHVVVETTAGMEGITELVSLIVSEPLERTRPLWQCTLVSGLDDDRWAIVSKVHHSMIDGLFGTEPLAVLVDGAISHQPEPAAWHPGSTPGPTELIGHSVADLFFNPAEQYRFLRSRSRRNRRRWERALRPAEPKAETDASGLRGPVGLRRSWQSVTVSMHDMRTARSICGVSTHNLILGLVASGIRELLAARDEASADRRYIDALVPLAVAERRSGYNGGIASEMVELSVGGHDLVDRIAEVGRRTASSSETGAVAVDAQIGLGGFAAPAVASLGLREVTRTGAVNQRPHVVVVNVPGPRHEVAVLGRPMVDMLPVMPLPAGVRLTVGVYSYLDRLTFGVTSDRDALPDGYLVASGIRQTLTTLIQSEREDIHANG